MVDVKKSLETDKQRQKRYLEEYNGIVKKCKEDDEQIIHISAMARNYYNQESRGIDAADLNSAGRIAERKDDLKRVYAHRKSFMERGGKLYSWLKSHGTPGSAIPYEPASLPSSVQQAIANFPRSEPNSGSKERTQEEQKWWQNASSTESKIRKINAEYAKYAHEYNEIRMGRGDAETWDSRLRAFHTRWVAVYNERKHIFTLPGAPADNGRGIPKLDPTRFALKFVDSDQHLDGGHDDEGHGRMNEHEKEAQDQKQAEINADAISAYMKVYTPWYRDYSALLKLRDKLEHENGHIDKEKWEHEVHAFNEKVEHNLHDFNNLKHVRDKWIHEGADPQRLRTKTYALHPIHDHWSGHDEHH